MIHIALAAALAFQAMSQNEMIAEGEDLGRSAYAMGLCGSMGYDVNHTVGIQWDEGYRRRLNEGGWAETVGTQAIEAGTTAEAAETPVPIISSAMSDSDLRRAATTFIQTVKARCRRLQVEHAGLISNLAAGDRNADAKLAIMLGQIDQ